MVRTRGNTPQAQVAPVAQNRTKRSTRSQSNEPLATSAQQSAKPKLARLGGHLPRSESNNRGASSKVTRNDLSIVEEADASDDEEEAAIFVGSTTPDRPDSRRGFSPTTVQRISISGTTARSTASDEEPERLLLELAPDLCNAAARILKVLTVPNSRARTTNIQEILKEVKNPASITGKQLWALEQNFDVLFKHFGDGFLDPQNTLEAILDPHSLPQGDSKSWGLTELVASANLAYLGKWLVNAQRDEVGTLDFLKALDEVCPLPFLSSLNEGSVFGDSELQDETFDFVLSVRTQVAVTEILQQFDQADFNPIEIIQAVFYAPLASGGYSKNTLRAWDLNGLGSGQTGLLPEYNTELRQRIAAIRHTAITDVQATEAGEYELMDALALAFPWSNFCITVLGWILRRKQELDTQIMRLGGASAILDAVKQEIGVEATVLETTPMKFDSFDSTLTGGSATKKKTGKIGPGFHQKLQQFKKRHSDVGGVQIAGHANTTEPASEESRLPSRTAPGSYQKLHQFKESHPGVGAGHDIGYLNTVEPPIDKDEEVPHGDVPPASQNQRQATGTVVVGDWVTIENPEGDTAEPGARPSQAQPLQAHSADQERIRKYQAKRRQNKENLKQSQALKPRMFIDPQEEAERVEFDEASQAGRQSPQAASLRAGSKSHGKRPAPSIAEEEENDEEEVSNDEGFQDDARSFPDRPQRASRRTALSDKPSPPKRARTALQESGPSSSRAPRGPSPDFEPDGNEDPPSTSHTQVKALARQNVALARMGNGQRRRKAWTPAEEKQLEYLIADHGTSWTELKKMDKQGEGLLADRDQVALKDKARNMKMAFLVARLELPTNFEYVTLDKKGREKLDALGIEY